MRMWLALALLTSLMQQPDAETRIINYLGDNLEPGQRVIISDLVNDVFTTPEERVALDSLYNTFFKIPMFLVQFQTSSGRVPTLQEISDQFVFDVDGQADVMLRIMEADPRIPSFFERDPTTGELTSLDVEPIRDHPQFGRAIERTIAGWEGNSIPPFSIETFGGYSITSASLAGKAHMIYIWFTNCPPCVETAPLLVELYDQYRSAGFEIVAANADRLLELPYSDEVRARVCRRTWHRIHSGVLVRGNADGSRRDHRVPDDVLRGPRGSHRPAFHELPGEGSPGRSH